MPSKTSPADSARARSARHLSKSFGEAELILDDSQRTDVSVASVEFGLGEGLRAEMLLEGVVAVSESRGVELELWLRVYECEPNSCRATLEERLSRETVAKVAGKPRPFVALFAERPDLLAKAIARTPGLDAALAAGAARRERDELDAAVPEAPARRRKPSI